MDTEHLICPACRARLGTGHVNAGLAACPSCDTSLRVDAFPALLRGTARGREPEPVVVDGESSCYYHPHYKVEAPCDECGRFLCALCGIDICGKHLCPACLASAQAGERHPWLVTRRVLYDGMALALGFAPLLLFLFCWPVTLITAPLIVFLCVRYWNAPKSVVPRGRWRMPLALLLAGAQFVAWAGVAAVMLFALFG
ncbi:MAG: hypothetical protein JXR94_02430 [Candidatus Hydrogenedentes bacterium]|nr:hypothetical protein [Candidatus Hydrogenedentota bacterium]